MYKKEPESEYKKRAARQCTEGPMLQLEPSQKNAWNWFFLQRRTNTCEREMLRDWEHAGAAFRVEDLMERVLEVWADTPYLFLMDLCRAEGRQDFVHICCNLSGIASKRSLMPLPASPPNANSMKHCRHRGLVTWSSFSICIVQNQVQVRKVLLTQELCIFLSCWGILL